jgi:hypothetical protein
VYKENYETEEEARAQQNDCRAIDELINNAKLIKNRDNFTLFTVLSVT